MSELYSINQAAEAMDSLQESTQNVLDSLTTQGSGTADVGANTSVSAGDLLKAQDTLKHIEQAGAGITATATTNQAVTQAVTNAMR